MDCEGWHKSMSHFPSMCCSSPINYQVLFYDGHARQFDDKTLNILSRHRIHAFILEEVDYLHDQPNNNNTNTNLKNLYGNKRMICTRHHGSLNFTLLHRNSFLVEIWEAFKLSSATITHKAFNKTYLLHPSQTDIGTNHQACLAGNQS